MFTASALRTGALRSGLLSDVATMFTSRLTHVEHAAQCFPDRRGAAEALRTAPRLHTIPGWGADALLRGPVAGAQRNALRYCSMASMASAPSDRVDSNGSGPAAEPCTSRAAAAAAAATATANSLRTVPGIGPKNEQLLIARGYSSVDALLQHFSKIVRGDTAAMASYLRVRSMLRQEFLRSFNAQDVLGVIAAGERVLRDGSHASLLLCA